MLNFSLPLCRFSQICFIWFLLVLSISEISLHLLAFFVSSWICAAGKTPGQKLTWTQRISAAIGVAKGIQFLHTGIVPGIFSNNLKITDVLMDHNLRVKISRFNLPLLAENRITLVWQKFNYSGNGVSSAAKGSTQARYNTCIPKILFQICHLRFVDHQPRFLYCF